MRIFHPLQLRTGSSTLILLCSERRLNLEKLGRVTLGETATRNGKPSITTPEWFHSQELQSCQEQLPLSYHPSYHYTYSQEAYTSSQLLPTSIQLWATSYQPQEFVNSQNNKIRQYFIEVHSISIWLSPPFPTLLEPPNHHSMTSSLTLPTPHHHYPHPRIKHCHQLLSVFSICV